MNQKTLFLDTQLILLATLFIAVDILIQSYLYIIFFGEESRTILFAITISIVALFALLSFMVNEIIVLFILFMLAVFFIGNLFSFSWAVNRPVNFSALAQYYSAFSFVIFYELHKRNLISIVLRILFVCSMLYLVIYCAIVLLFWQGAIEITAKRVFFVLDDNLRGSRLVLYQGAGLYALMYSLSKLIEKLRISFFACFIIAVASIALSQYRVLILFSAIIILVYLITRSLTTVRYFAFFCFLFIAAYLSIGLVSPTLNPFDFNLTDASLIDTSRIGRQIQYTTMIPYIWKYPVFGVGIENNDRDYLYYTGHLLFASDIGLIGTWFQFGIVGVLLVCVLPVCICCFQKRIYYDPVVGRDAARALILAGSTIAMLVAFAQPLTGTAAVIFQIMLANTLFRLQHGIKKYRLPSQQSTSEVLRKTPIHRID